MEDCKAVDPANEQAYATLGADIIIVQATRMIDFLKRHHLLEEFKAEDAAGKR